jgi:hypothetical protein
MNATARARRESRLRIAVGVTGVLMFVASASFVACTSTSRAPTAVSANTTAAQATSWGRRDRAPGLQGPL